MLDPPLPRGFLEEDNAVGFIQHQNEGIFMATLLNTMPLGL
jgi:hypothetical protein